MEKGLMSLSYDIMDIDNDLVTEVNGQTLSTSLSITDLIVQYSAVFFIENNCKGLPRLCANVAFGYDFPITLTNSGTPYTPASEPFLRIRLFGPRRPHTVSVPK